MPRNLWADPQVCAGPPGPALRSKKQVPGYYDRPTRRRPRFRGTAPRLVQVFGNEENHCLRFYLAAPEYMRTVDTAFPASGSAASTKTSLRRAASTRRSAPSAGRQTRPCAFGALAANTTISMFDQSICAVDCASLICGITAQMDWSNIEMVVFAAN